MDDSYQRSVRLEIVERLETVIAAILRLAGCRTVARLLPGARRVATRTGYIRRLGAVTMQCADVDTACLGDFGGFGHLAFKNRTHRWGGGTAIRPPPPR